MLHPLHQPASRVLLCPVLAILVLLACRGYAQGQLTVNPPELRFEKVDVGQSETLKATFTNTGSSTVTVSAMTTHAGFVIGHLKLPLTLPPGGNAEFSVTFEPSGVGGSAGSEQFRSNAPNSILSLGVSGIGVEPWSLIANPPSLAFGKVPRGGSLSFHLAFTNNGRSTVTLSEGQIAGSGFRVNGLMLPTHLLPGHSLTVRVTFTPQAQGKVDGEILVTNPTSPVLHVPLSGIGTLPGDLIVEPKGLNFGTVPDLIGKTLSGTLRAQGSSLTVSSVTVSNPQFILRGLEFPFTLANGATKTFHVTFTPTGHGHVPGTLSFVSNAANSPLEAQLSGSGTQVYNVSLSWNASTSEVVGYNIYRRQKDQTTGIFGKFEKINTTLDPLTTYVDGTVASGQTYYYSTSAVNASGQHSVLSNEVLVTIP